MRKARKMKKKIFIFGVGKSSRELEKKINFSKAEIVGYLDNNVKLQGKVYKECIIYAPSIVEKKEFDYVVIASINYKQIYRNLIEFKISKEKIISFFDKDIVLGELEYKDILKANWKLVALSVIQEQKMEKMREDFRLRLQNIKYELPEELRNVTTPLIDSGEAAIDKVVQEQKSLVRFGDGEFEIIFQRDRAGFQQKSEKLSKRLKEVLQSEEAKVLIGIADVYGSLEMYEDDAAYGIRKYLTPEKRNEIMECLDMKRTYYDAYLTRPYIIYKEKEKAGDKFRKLKSIWKNRNVILIEGRGTRFGVGNDLLGEALSVKRILAPEKNAFKKYDEIFEKACEVPQIFQVDNPIYLTALGPAATIMTYDLAMRGYQAIDIGHVDIEYEWFLRGCNERIDIPQKSVNEVLGGERIQEIQDTKYEKEIIFRCL